MSMLTYHAPQPIPPGSVVKIAIRSQNIWGIVHEAVSPPTFTTKLAEVTPYTVSLRLIGFLQQIATHTAQPIGFFAALSLAGFSQKHQNLPEFVAIKKSTQSLKKTFADHTTVPLSRLHTLKNITSLLEKQNVIPASPIPYPTPVYTLTEAQNKACHALSIESCSLLEGVTGSGKTEVYLAHLDRHTCKKSQALILTPTISLAEQTALRAQSFFADRVIVWHTLTSPQQREIYWASINQGFPYIIIGARSSIFLPFKNLSCVIVDEEHDNSSFKQDTQPIYHARSASFLLAKAHQCPIIYATATPSFEMQHACAKGPVQHVKLTQSFYTSKKSFEIINLKEFYRDTPRLISPPLQQAIQSNLTSKKLSLLFLNRRGFAPLALCTDCGFRISCPHCTAFLSFHKKQNTLTCHHCSFLTVLPKTCPHCNGSNIILLGAGIEKLEEEAHKLFPGANILALSSDAILSKKQLTSISQSIANHEVDILLGTQILSTGLDIPTLNLVGIIDAEFNICSQDIRSTEHALQRLEQLAGRCGRRNESSTVIIQTFNPEDPLLHAFTNNTKESFIQTSLQERATHKLPPYYKLCLIRITGSDKNNVLDTAKRLYTKKPQNSAVEVLGPSPAPLEVIKDQHRWFFLLRAQKHSSLLLYVSQWALLHKKHNDIKIHIDTEPTSFL